jgi:hypothetical protein
VAFRFPKDDKWHSEWIYIMTSKTQPTDNDWMFKESEFDSQQGTKLSLLHSVQIGFWAQPVSYAMGTGGCWPGRGVKLTTHRQLLPSLRILGLAFHSPHTSSLSAGRTLLSNILKNLTFLIK